ncbi:Hypothetical protein A7982_11786 [Minicystis rosea]|nr:Hypothetical protein A7982_11786 [Minicystis rosea]
MVVLMMGFAVAAGCGARSNLLGLEGAIGGGTGGHGGDVIDAGPDAPPPPPPCALVAAGAAVDVVALPDRHATAPSAVAFGAMGVAVQVFASGGNSLAHDDIQLVGFTMGDAWPSGLAQTAAPQLFGIESHGWANLVLARSQAELALTWHGDPGGKGRPLFRLWDIATWSPKAPIDISPNGEGVLATAPGAGVGTNGVGYGGDGYGVIHREVIPGGGTNTRPVAVVLNAQGERVLGPHPVAAAAEYPGASTAIVWSGSTYLMATSFTTCPSGDMLCAPLSVVITRVRPASGDGKDDSGIDFVTALPATPGSAVIGRVAIAHHAGRTYVAFSEGDQSGTGNPRRVRIAELSPTGDLVGGPVTIDDAAPMQSRLTLVASDLGVSATWAEDGDITAPDDVPGRSMIVTTHLDLDLTVLSTRVAIPVTRWQTYGAPQGTALTQPRSLFLVWSGRSESNGFDDTWAARLDCAK